MKNFITKYLICIPVLILFTYNVYAQNKNGGKAAKTRCFTMEYLEARIKADPTLPEKWKAQGELIQKQNAKQSKTLSEQSISVIPVVFHLVMNADQQDIVDDAFIQRQVDILNRDFAGLNPDSSKLPAAFKEVFGHSQIRFCLAKRTPNNVATNGIERKVSNTNFSLNTLSDLKKSVKGGLDQWDGNKYLNIWLANFSDNTLGIATLPFTTPADEQGVCIDWGTIDMGCESPYAGSYDAGRTLVHEIGHYFYLMHIWGDDNGGCSGNDFRTQAGFPLPASCIDDTPGQADATNSCLSGVQKDVCNTTASGFMYQNYMDYTYDACYGMFTIGQVCRMQACLDNYRSSLKTSNGCEPVIAVNNDVRVSEILNPVSRGFACGVKTSYCNTDLTPQVLIVNDGDIPLTSLTFTIRVDNNILTTQNWAGNLSPGDFVYVNIDAFMPPSGVHTLRINTSDPNGGVDERPDNDYAEATYEILPPALNPPVVAQSFEAPVFPPAGWEIINVDNTLSWERTTLAGNPGVASARLNSYEYASYLQTDYLLTPKIKTTGFDSLIVNFNVAYAKYSNVPEDWDELEIVYSDDCGLTWKPSGYKKKGDELATNGGAVTGNLSFVPTLNEWRKERVAIDLCHINAPEIIFAFKLTNRYGNNTYIDNVSIDKVDGLLINAGLSKLITPNNLVCNKNIEPGVSLTNNGSAPLTSVTFNISVDGALPTTYNWTGNLGRCSTTVLKMPAITTNEGSHTFLIYTTDPNGAADQFTGNDTLRSTFDVVAIINAPLMEDFENNVFPSPNFILQNPDNSLTWERTTTAAQAGIGSMVIKNYHYPVANTIDKLVTPQITVTNIDSAFVSFDYAYAPGENYPNSTDTLEIAVSKDCGLTYTTVWKKWGQGLHTVDPNYPQGIDFVPEQSQWRNTRISLTDIVEPDDRFQVFIIAKSNKQNNLYIDNLNIFTKTFPQRLRDQGYLVYPNPFSNSFLIHHYNPPVHLQSVQVFSTIGELVWEKRYAGNATTEININLSKLPKGVYLLKLIYSNKSVVERIVKN